MRDERKPAHIGEACHPAGGNAGNSEGSRPSEWVDPVTTDPKGEAHCSPVRNTPALTHSNVCGATMETSFEKGELVRLHPWYVTGIVEGEGCFMVSFNRRQKLNVGIETRPAFSLSLSQRDLNLLKDIQAFFHCGAIRYSKADRTYKYEVRSVADLAKKILPHFQKYPLAGAKSQDFEKFAEIVRLVHARQHLNGEVLRQIIHLAYSMNPAGKRRIAKDELLRWLGEMKV